MSRFKVGALVLGVCVLLAASIKGQAQTPATPDSPAATSTVAASPQAVVPRLMKFNGVLRDVTGKPVTGPVDVTFALYSTDAGGNPLWFETQSVEADEQGRYSALIGVMHSEGLPMDLFTSGEARWLGVQVANEVEQKPRVLLLSVPYALKAADAETLGGLPASSYMLSPSASNWAGSAGQTTSTASVPAASTGNEGTSAKKGVSRKNTACSSLTADGNASANQIAFYSAPCALSEDANLVDVGGKVGIGTADPTEGGQVGSRFTLSTATDAATGFSIFTGAAKRFALNTQSSGGFLFYDGQGAVWNPGLSQVGGNVGIGTADPTMSGQVGSRLTLSTAADSATGFSIFTGSAKRFALNPQSSGGFLIYDGGGGAWNPGLAQVGGNVGIGTTAPAQRLSVVGMVQSTTGGFMFPDGTTQTTAAAGGVASFNGRTGAVVPQTNDYAFSQLSGTVGSTQLSATYTNPLTFSGVLTLTNSANSFTGNGANLTNLSFSNITSGTLPSSALSGTYSSGLTFSNASNNYYGNGSNLSGITASNTANLGGYPASDYARLDINDTFAGNVTAVLGSFTGSTQYGALFGENTGQYSGNSGVQGKNTSDQSASIGVFGYASSTGSNQTQAVNGTAATGVAFAGVNNSTSWAPLIVNNNTASLSGEIFNLSDPTTGAYCYMYTNGSLYCSGTKSAVVPIAGGRKVALYAVEAPENWFEDYGSGKLASGVATITLDPVFLQTVNAEVDYHVFLTPGGDCNGLYVAQKLPTSFEVRELGGGKSNVAFDYRVIVRRKGYEAIRLQDMTETARPMVVRSPATNPEAARQR